MVQIQRVGPLARALSTEGHARTMGLCLGRVSVGWNNHYFYDPSVKSSTAKRPAPNHLLYCFYLDGISQDTWFFCWQTCSCSFYHIVAQGTLLAFADLAVQQGGLCPYPCCIPWAAWQHHIPWVLPWAALPNGFTFWSRRGSCFLQTEYEFKYFPVLLFTGFLMHWASV